jgi:hypothetical protein
LEALGLPTAAPYLGFAAMDMNPNSAHSDFVTSRRCKAREAKESAISRRPEEGREALD